MMAPRSRLGASLWVSREISGRPDDETLSLGDQGEQTFYGGESVSRQTSPAVEAANAAVTDTPSAELRSAKQQVAIDESMAEQIPSLQSMSAV